MKKQLALSTLVCGLLLGATHLQAQTPATPSDSVAKKEAKALANPAIMQKDHAAAAKVEESIAKRNFEAKMKRSVFEKEAQADKKKLIQAVINKRIKDHKPAPKEIIIGMQDTFNALQAMGKGKKDEAQKDLEAAIQSFDAALKADPALDLVPVDERFQAFVFLGSSDVIAARIKLAEQLLKDHDIQATIDTIAPLKDELDITTITIPMKLYPEADKKALDALKKGQEQAALDAIAEAMNSLVIFQTVIPTPLLTAQDLILQASRLDKSKKEEAMKLLNAAQEELKRATLLGYTHKHDPAYKALSQDIHAIQKEIKGKNMVAKMYDKLKKDFEHLVHSVKGDKKKVDTSTKKPAVK